MGSECSNCSKCDLGIISESQNEIDRQSLEYRLVSETGPAHDKTFEVEVVIDNIIYGKGEGKSKKEAEQHAAYDAYKKQARW